MSSNVVPEHCTPEQHLVFLDMQIEMARQSKKELAALYKSAVLEFGQENARNGDEGDDRRC
jgi:hypothetical protein